jgi:DoxX-like protein
MSSLLLSRVAIALVWLYQGLWLKLLGGGPRHQKIVGAVPFLNTSQARQALLALGFLECFLAVWVISGFRAREAALIETLLLGCMNAAGLAWARNLIPDPVGMLLQNFVFVVLAWIAGSYATAH